MRSGMNVFYFIKSVYIKKSYIEIIATIKQALQSRFISVRYPILQNKDIVILIGISVILYRIKERAAGVRVIIIKTYNNRVIIFTIPRDNPTIEPFLR